MSFPRISNNMLWHSKDLFSANKMMAIINNVFTIGLFNGNFLVGSSYFVFDCLLQIFTIVFLFFFLNFFPILFFFKSRCVACGGSEASVAVHLPNPNQFDAYLLYFWNHFFYMLLECLIVLFLCFLSCFYKRFSICSDCMRIMKKN